MEIIGKDKSVGIFVVDGRQEYMAKLLKEKGYRVECLDNRDGSLLPAQHPFWEANVLLLPVPVSRVKQMEEMMRYLTEHKGNIRLCIGGVFPQELVKVLQENQIPWLDVLENQEVARKNAIATAEGTIAELSKLMPINLEGAKIIVMGFGKCAKPIAEKLYCMGADVSVVARSERALSLAHYFGFLDYPMDADIPYDRADAIVNTIPAPVIDETVIRALRQDTVIVDIASAPGGCDFACCEKYHIKYKHALGLPGIYSPKTSGEILLEAMPFGYKPSETKWKYR